MWIYGGIGETHQVIEILPSKSWQSMVVDCISCDGERGESCVKDLPKDFGLKWNMELPFDKLENNVEKGGFWREDQEFSFRMLSLRYFKWRYCIDDCVCMKALNPNH